jgi:hypothetical protein
MCVSVSLCVCETYHVMRVCVWRVWCYSATRVHNVIIIALSCSGLGKYYNIIKIICYGVRWFKILNAYTLYMCILYNIYIYIVHSICHRYNIMYCPQTSITFVYYYIIITISIISRPPHPTACYIRRYLPPGTDRKPVFRSYCVHMSYKTNSVVYIIIVAMCGQNRCGHRVCHTTGPTRKSAARSVSLDIF